MLEVRHGCHFIGAGAIGGYVGVKLALAKTQTHKPNSSRQRLVLQCVSHKNSTTMAALDEVLTLQLCIQPLHGRRRRSKLRPPRC